MGGPRSNLRPAGLNPVRHWTVFHMFLLRSARGFCLQLESELGGKRENRFWKTGSHGRVLLVKDQPGANWKDSQRKQSNG